MTNVKKFVAERTHHQRLYDRRVNKRQMQKQESKVDLGKALDADLVVTESCRTESGKHDISSKSGNDANADNADIKPVYDKEPMAKEKVFAIASLKNELRKLKGINIDTKFAKPSVLGKLVLQPLRKQPVFRQSIAFKYKRPQISKSWFASHFDVKKDLSKPVTQHYLPKRRESMIASSEYRNSSKNMPRFSSNDMVHNHYLEEARKKKQERDRNSRTKVNSRAKIQSHKTRNSNEPVDQKSHIQKPGRQIFTGHKYYSNKSFAVYEKTSPRSCLRWKPTGRILNTVGLRLQCKESQEMDIQEKEQKESQKQTNPSTGRKRPSQVEANEAKRARSTRGQASLSREETMEEKGLCDWEFLSNKGLAQPLFDFANTDTFSGPQWVNLFQINKPIFRKLVREFFASFEFDASPCRESRDVATLSGLRGAEIVNSTHLTHLFWPSIGDDRFNVEKLKAKCIRNPRIKLAHREVMEEGEGDDEEGDKEGGNKGVGGSTDIYRNMSQGDWQVRQARWID
ncbi:hypothetical protein Tco_0446626 [Tanacetum coccineum]